MVKNPPVLPHQHAIYRAGPSYVRTRGGRRIQPDPQIVGLLSKEPHRYYLLEEVTVRLGPANSSSYQEIRLARFALQAVLDEGIPITKRIEHCPHPSDPHATKLFFTPASATTFRVPETWKSLDFCGEMVNSLARQELFLGYLAREVAAFLGDTAFESSEVTALRHLQNYGLRATIFLYLGAVDAAQKFQEELESKLFEDCWL